jgi:hypothetical protein
MLSTIGLLFSATQAPPCLLDQVTLLFPLETRRTAAGMQQKSILLLVAACALFAYTAGEHNVVGTMLAGFAACHARCARTRFCKSRSRCPPPYTGPLCPSAHHAMHFPRPMSAAAFGGAPRH